MCQARGRELHSESGDAARVWINLGPIGLNTTCWILFAMKWKAPGRFKYE